MLPVIRRLDDDAHIDLKLLVTGGHLVPGQGLTVSQIREDGFAVDETVDIVLASDTATAVAKSFGVGVIGYADALDRINPDLLIILGDRYEALAVAVTAALRLLPIAHVAGGEVTTGSTDDAVRHAITKLANLHFTATEEARRRVIQLGEAPSRVHNTGAPTLDTIRTIPLLERSALASALGIELRVPTITVTYHPATADPSGSREGLTGLLKALDTFEEATVVFTGTNVDQGGGDIATLIQDYIDKHRGQAAIFPSLGQIKYLSLVRHSSVIAGNSSSGIAEAPALHTPTVNIGSRQQGRPRADSVLDCGETAPEIETAIRQALTPMHQERTRLGMSPYGDGFSAERIVDILRNVDLESLRDKEFYGLPDFRR